jgi:hypothetical protein
MAGQRHGSEPSHHDQRGREESDLHAELHSHRTAELQDAPQDLPIQLAARGDDTVAAQRARQEHVGRQPEEHQPARQRRRPRGTDDAERRGATVAEHQHVIGADVDEVREPNNDESRRHDADALQEGSQHREAEERKRAVIEGVEKGGRLCRPPPDLDGEAPECVATATARP